MPQISTDLEGKFRRKNFAEEGFFGYFFYLNLDQFSYFLMNLTAFLCHTWFEYHPWQAVPDLPHPLASLWSNPGQISAAKQYKCLKYETTQFAQQHMNLSTSG